MSYIQCEFLAEHFLSEDRPEGMSEEDFDKHSARLAQEIQDVVEGFCEYDAKWTEALSASAGQAND